MHGRVNSLLTLIHVDGMSVAKNSTKLGQDLLNIIFNVSIYTYNPPNNLLGLSWDKADHVIQHRTMVMRRYPASDLISVIRFDFHGIGAEKQASVQAKL